MSTQPLLSNGQQQNYAAAPTSSLHDNSHASPSRTGSFSNKHVRFTPGAPKTIVLDPYTQFNNKSERIVEVQLKRSYFQSLFEWPDALRYRGSVIPRIIPSVTLMILFTSLIAFLYVSVGWQRLSLPNSVVPSLSVVLGLLLAFRTNTAYDRFWEGRKLFQSVTSTIRNLCRSIWIGVPEDSQTAHDEKMACIKLLLAFVVATKHHLREEFGTDYYDLDILLPKNWIPAAATEVRVVTNPMTPPLSAPAGAGQAALAAANANPLTSPQGGGGDNPNDPVNMPIGTHDATVVATYSAREEDLPDEPDADMSLPMEIIFRIGLYVAQAREAKTLDAGVASAISSGLATLTDCLGSFERILYTPIPKAYTIHLKQAIFLYILALPFTLVKELGYFVILMVGLVSFTLLGIEGIGSEIENPFGYDDNDLPLNQYCEELKKEIEYIIYHVPSKSRSILLEGR